MSITNIVAIAMLSGSLQCPPANEAPSAVESANASAPVTVQMPISVQAADNAGVVSAPVANPDTVTLEPLPSDTIKQADPATAKATDKNIIVVTARTGPPPGDPVEAVNEVSFVAVQAIDGAFVAPVAQGYEAAVPNPVRDGIHNVINNLDEPVVFVNFLLQLKIGRAFETVGRFALEIILEVCAGTDDRVLLSCQNRLCGKTLKEPDHSSNLFLMCF